MKLYTIYVGKLLLNSESQFSLLLQPNTILRNKYYEENIWGKFQPNESVHAAESAKGKLVRGENQ